MKRYSKDKAGKIFQQAKDNCINHGSQFGGDNDVPIDLLWDDFFLNEDEKYDEMKQWVDNEMSSFSIFKNFLNVVMPTELLDGALPTELKSIRHLSIAKYVEMITKYNPFTTGNPGVFKPIKNERTSELFQLLGYYNPKPRYDWDEPAEADQSQDTPCTVSSPSRSRSPGKRNTRNKEQQRGRKPLETKKGKEEAELGKKNK